MLFPDLILHSRVNQTWHTSGMDSLEHCNDPLHFKNYPWPIVYEYNSRGFRDQEWPKEFRDVIWCVGDSFTVGIGSPIEHTWPWLLSQVTNQRTINVSMDGASNQWISRRAAQILSAGLAQHMVIQWSYTHRRESQDFDQLIDQRWRDFYQDVKDSSWPVCPPWRQRDQLPVRIQQELARDPYWQQIDFIHDEERRIDIPTREAVLDPTINSENFRWCLEQVEHSQGSARVIHTFIPEWSNDADLAAEISQWPAHRLWLPEIQRLDWARDHHHYDRETAQTLCAQLKNKLLS